MMEPGFQCAGRAQEWWTLWICQARHAQPQAKFGLEGTWVHPGFFFWYPSAIRTQESPHKWEKEVHKIGIKAHTSGTSGIPKYPSMDCQPNKQPLVVKPLIQQMRQTI